MPDSITAFLRGFVDEAMDHSSQEAPIYDAYEQTHAYFIAKIMDPHRRVSVEVARDVGGGRFDIWGWGVEGCPPLYGEVKQAWIQEAHASFFGLNALIADQVSNWVDDLSKLNGSSDQGAIVHCAFLLVVYGLGSPPATLTLGDPAPAELRVLTKKQANDWTTAASGVSGKTAVGTVLNLIKTARKHGVCVAAFTDPPLSIRRAHFKDVDFCDGWFMPLAFEWIRLPA